MDPQSRLPSRCQKTLQIMTEQPQFHKFLVACHFNNSMYLEILLLEEMKEKEVS